MFFKKKKSRRKKKKGCKFLTKVVIFCIAFISIYTIVQSYLNYRLGVELSPALTENVYRFFGTELVGCIILRILDGEENKLVSKIASLVGSKKNTESIEESTNAVG